ncbi:hypothetical protein GCM10011609_16510 [Lentzea pudingi]|uniref:Uncharacterized protein n=1 Tax=Lentzea pudingi TaxID=1789439 RepID=A0ABQ2HIG2_9PSEU|nr:hypothetical protein [Lentzea pudingi]GGM81215.1 hypothetical protein GCM10011609_16510 [Lentzea pudingi]
MEGKKCSQCGSTPARTREGHTHYPLCDDCAQRQTRWSCPGCGRDMYSSLIASTGDPCFGCESQLMFAAQCPQTRDEIDTAVATLPNIRTIKRIRDLTGCGLRVAIGIHADRHRARRDAAE